MTENNEKKAVESNLTIGVYTIYDCILKQYDIPFCIQDSKLGDYLTLLVNDVQSKYYNHEVDYIVNKIGSFDSDTGEIQLKFIERVSILDKYIDVKRRNLQTVIQTLNFLPSGYFKMPDEMKKDIQEKINQATTKYIQDYVVPDIEVCNK